MLTLMVLFGMALGVPAGAAGVYGLRFFRKNRCKGHRRSLGEGMVRCSSDASSVCNDGLCPGCCADVHKGDCRRRFLGE